MVEGKGGRWASATPPAQSGQHPVDGMGVLTTPVSTVEAQPGLAETNRANGERSRAAASTDSLTGTASAAMSKSAHTPGGGEAVESHGLSDTGAYAGAASAPILDYLATSARCDKPTLRKPWWELTEEEKQERKFKRAYQRFMLGVKMPGEYRLLTLTTPPDFKDDLHTAWRKFLMRMRRRGMIREYYAVKEWNKAHTCQHLHVVLRLDYIGYEVARRQWEAITGAKWIHVRYFTK